MIDKRPNHSRYSANGGLEALSVAWRMHVGRERTGESLPQARGFCPRLRFYCKVELVRDEGVSIS